MSGLSRKRKIVSDSDEAADVKKTKGTSKKGEQSNEVVSESDSSDDESQENGSNEKLEKAPWDHPGLSEFERRVFRNIEARNKALIEAGFPEMVRDLSSINSSQPIKTAPVKTKPKIPAKNRKPAEVLPRREPSRRLRNLAAAALVKQDETVCEDNDDTEVDNRLLGTVQLEDKGNVLTNITSSSVYNPNLDLVKCDTNEYRDHLLSLKCLKMEKVLQGRIQSMIIHPTSSKPIVLAGDKYGNFGTWDLLEKDTDKSLKSYEAHRCSLNCISVARSNASKVFTTSFDGTMHMMDFGKSVFTNVFATDFDSARSHLVWHDEMEEETFLVSHGQGSVGVLDLRAGKQMQRWINCFDRSARTVQHHPERPEYFLVSSGTGSFKIFDLRNSEEAISVAEHGRALTSAFFSPNGQLIVSTCADDRLRVFDSSSLTFKLPMLSSYSHNNHTGRWLSVFKANWAPMRNDLFHVGSMMTPRRMNFYKATGGPLLDLIDEEMNSIVSVISMHPTLPVIAGANSSGKVFTFGPLDFLST